MSPASFVTVNFGKKVSIAPLREDQANWPINYVRPTRFAYDATDDKYFKLASDGTCTSTVLTPEQASEVEELAEKIDGHLAQIQELLRVSLPTTIWLQIKTARLPGAMWEALKRKCTEKQKSTVKTVRDAMRRVRSAEGEDPHAAIEPLLSYQNELAEMGCTLDNDDIVECIRLAFPHFRPALNALESNAAFARKHETDAAKRNLIYVTTEEALEVVQEAWQRQLDDRAGNEAAGHTALGANMSKKKGAAAKKGKAQSSAAPATGDPCKCFTCGGVGHLQRDCPTPRDDNDKPPCRDRNGGRWRGRNKNRKSGAATSSETAKVSVTLSAVTSPLPPTTTTEANYVPVIQPFSPPAVPAASAQAARTSPTYKGSIVNSGATMHISPLKSNFTSLLPMSPIQITAADGQSFIAAWTLLSVGVLDGKGLQMTFEDSHCFIRSLRPKRELLLKLPLKNGLYCITGEESPSDKVATVAIRPVRMSLYDMHVRCGHHRYDDCLRMARLPETKIMLTDTVCVQCEVCIRANASSHNFLSESDNRVSSQEVGAHWAMDLVGPMEVQSYGSANYGMFPLDLRLRYMRFYVLRCKSDTEAIYTNEFEPWVIQHLRPAGIKVLRTDRGGEFTSNSFIAHTRSKGTVRELTVHDSPQ
ncbi:unnamed protein product [Peniophora sp. CBMAI 1063]|nr:unnamed protein product [Peniophora sp. CBMAI 1063]